MKDLHFVGIGGIGMSALAAAAADLDWRISGSDRGAEKPENAAVFNALKSRNITIFPQDGSRFAAGTARPDALVYSTAIEADNPDFLAAGELPRLHRAELLKLLLEEFSRISVAVTGSCGKSTVCCYLAETLERLNADPVMISGALAKRFRTPENAGNYRGGQGKYLIFEADESDKSLLRYGADYAIILNIGTDHYDKAELARVFGGFLHSVRRGAVLSQEVFQAVKEFVPAGLPLAVLGSAAENSIARYIPGGAAPAQAEFGDGRVLTLPAPGRHMAENALFIRVLLNMLGFPDDEVMETLPFFDGVWRRNDFSGTTPRGAMVFDDYAHNPEKIVSCISGMKERGCRRIFAVFQPHGYGPFGFMREALFAGVDKVLTPDDRFILLEPFYAGGTSSFSPHADDVCAGYRKNSAFPEKYLFFPDRKPLREFLQQTPGADDLIVIMGARDNSLNDFAASLTKEAIVKFLKNS